MRATAVKTKIDPSSEADIKPAPGAPVAVRVAKGGSEPVASPARELQARLESDYAEGWDGEAAGAVTRWPLYLAVPFWLGLASLMWVGLITAGLTLIRHL
jgi:hypothetical protein